MNRTIAVLAATIALATPASAQWVPARGGYVPNASLPAGYETNGQTLYICRVHLDVGNRQAISPGKIRPGFNGCNYGWSGGERTEYEYTVLRTVTTGWGWETASGGEVPDFAVVAGRDPNGRPLFVCRAQYRGGLQLGKVRRAFRGCNIIYGGKEFPVYWYSVLTARW